MDHGHAAAVRGAGEGGGRGGLDLAALRGGGDLVFGRIVGSDIEVPNMLGNVA